MNRNRVRRLTAKSLRVVAQALDPQPIVAENTDRGGFTISCRGVRLARVESAVVTDDAPPEGVGAAHFAPDARVGAQSH
jgi:hypothetical protein